MRLLPLFAAGIVPLCISSCATVVSDRSASTQSQGLVYYLPMRLVQVTVTPAPSDLSVLQKTRDESRKDLFTAREAMLAAAAAEGAARKKLAAATPRQQAARAEAYSLARLKSEHARQEHAQLLWVADRASERLERARRQGCEYTAKVESLPAQADVNHRYVAHLSHNGTRDDDMTLEVNGDGLLTSAKLTAADKTGDILVQLAGAASAESQSGLVDYSSKLEGDACLAPKVLVFDPAADYSGQATGMLKAVERINGQLSEYGISLSHDAIPQRPQQIAPRWGAIYYRAPMPVLVSVRQDGRLVSSSVVNVPQLGPTAYLPMKANGFVTTTDEITFADGSVTKWASKRPSEVLAVVKVPVEIMKAVISVPTEIFQLKVNHDTQASTLRQNEINLLKEKIKRIELEQCVAKATKDGTPASECFKS